MSALQADVEKARAGALGPNPMPRARAGTWDAQGELRHERIHLVSLGTTGGGENARHISSLLHVRQLVPGWQMTLILSTFLSIRRKISDMQRFLSSLGCELVYKQQEGKFKLPHTKIIIICSSQRRVLLDRLRVRTQARREGLVLCLRPSERKQIVADICSSRGWCTQFFSVLP